MTSVVADTHALIWYVCAPDKLSTLALNALDNPNIGITLANLDRNITETIKQIDRATVPDMPDRIIAATALYLDIPLVSCDSKIQNLTSVSIIW